MKIKRPYSEETTFDKISEGEHFVIEDYPDEIFKKIEALWRYEEVDDGEEDYVEVNAVTELGQSFTFDLERVRRVKIQARVVGS